jgi:hypothetical protein
LLPERKGLGFVPRKRRAKAKVAAFRRLRGKWHCRSGVRDGRDVEAVAGEAAAVAKAMAWGCVGGGKGFGEVGVSLTWQRKRIG